MTQIAILSGKGGSGKTFVSSSLAVLMENTVFADCDVDAANLYLMLDPTESACHPFVSGSAALVDAAKCTACGACVAACRFAAIEMHEGGQASERSGPTALVDPIACEGCGVWRLVCPADAVTLVEQQRGTWCSSKTRFGPLLHAHLEPGEENSGKLVERVRREAARTAEASGARRILIDGPPGTGCAAKSAMTGADFLVIVAEPTVSGVHDMERLVELAEHFGLPMGLVVNKSDLSARQTDRLRAHATHHDIIALGAVRFSAEVPRALTRLEPYPLARDDAISDQLRAIWSRLDAAVDARPDSGARSQNSS